MKRNKKFNRENRKLKLQKSQSGRGLFLFKNNSRGSLQLPKISSDGKRWIEVNQTWEGDSFFLSMIPKEAILLKTIISPDDQEKEEKVSNEKLLLDQPDQITEEGKIEHVVSVENKKINENKTSLKSKKSKKLLTEDPVGDLTIIIE
jgi:hypothetical protein